MKAHAIMIALPYQGHLNPFVGLAMKLASKGLIVTFVNTEYAHHQIQISTASSSLLDIFFEARDSGLDIRYTTISDGFPLEFDRDAHFIDYWESLLSDFPSLVAQFVGNIISSSLSLPCPFLVADTCSIWPGMVAEKLNLVNVSFWTEPAIVFAIDYHVHLLKQNGHYPPTDDDEHVITYIPGVESISTKDLMSQLQEADTTISHTIVFRAFEEVAKADFILHNTVQELEPHTLSALNKNQPTYAIGPVNFSTKLVNVPKSMLTEVDCTKWLDSRPPGSVLYVSFGSIAQASREVMREIAQGLLLTQVSFIWAIRPQLLSSADGTDVLPAGFENDVKDRGLVVPWCNQPAVLSSPAVGGFLTHCGWNSILESIWWGVPMICYPIVYDQPTNRKLVVDDWKIGINLCDGVCVHREEVAEKIEKLMTDGIGNEMKNVRAKLHDALIQDGSSQINFDQFLKDLNGKMEAKNRANLALDVYM